MIACSRSRICFHLFGGFARVGVPGEDHGDDRVFALVPGRHRDRQPDARQALHPDNDPLRRLRVDDGDQRRSEPRREVLVEDLGAAARVGLAGLALAEADCAVMGEVAEGEDEEAGGNEEDEGERAAANEAGDLLPAGARPAAADRGPGGPEGALAEDREQGGEQGEGAEQHHRDPNRQDRPEPVGRFELGDEQDEHRGDHRARRGGERRRRLAHRQRQRLGGGAAALQLLAVAVDEQQRVVGAGSEHEHEEEKRPLGVDGDPARLDQQVGDPDRDHVGGADREQRQHRQQRRPVDDQKQYQNQRNRRDQQRLAGFRGEAVEVSGDPGRAGDIGSDPGDRMAGEVGADLGHAVLDSAGVGRVDREDDQRRFAVAREGAYPTDVLGDVAERLRGVGGEGVDGRRRPGHLEPVEPDPEAADRPQVPLGEPALAVKDDHRRDLLSATAPAAAPAAAPTLQGFLRPRRFGVPGQEARLAGRGDPADMGTGDPAANPDYDPDRDRQPPSPPAGDRGSQPRNHGCGRRAGRIAGEGYRPRYPRSGRCRGC